jgi:hypothetical protein
LKGDHTCAYKCTPGPNAPDDPIDPNYVDENCDGSDGVVDKCLFVASDGADTPTAGTRNAPMKTIAYAIKAGKDRGMDVCVSGEIYTGEVDLVSGVSVYGGFNENDPDFAFRRESSVTSALTAKGTVVLATAIDVDTYLEGFVINAAVPDPPAVGASVYAVRLIGGLGTLYVRYNNITTDPGQDGAPGKDGAMGADGTPGEDGKAGCSHCGVGAPNPPGGAHGGNPPASPCGGASGGKGGQGGWDQTAGEGGGSGTGANSGGGAGGGGMSTCLVSGGGDGDKGGSPTEPGANGMDGDVAMAKGAVAPDGSYAPSNGGDGKQGSPGNAGGGGGGGGGGTNGGACYGDQGSGGGSGGTGGCGGFPGTAGTSGGASFGVSAHGGKIVVGLNRIQAGKGGNGGVGGKGGSGGAGAKGGLGQGRNDDGGASGPGGHGSAGGVGGNGAGGAGGPSACIALAPGVVLDETPTNQCSPFGGGTGGAGGNNAANKGPDGLTLPTLTL